MLFHVTFEVYEDIVLPEAKSLRNEWLRPQMQKIQESGKVRERGSGLFLSLLKFNSLLTEALRVFNPTQICLLENVRSV